MNYAKIKPCDIANGPGVRVSLFVSGCTHHCKGCFNPETWSFDYGSPFTKDTEDKIIDLLSHDYISGLSILGGEPMEPGNAIELISLVSRVSAIPDKTIWIYSGYTYDQLHDTAQQTLLGLSDVLVDGEFNEREKNPGLLFRGSSNQRLIDLKQTISNNEVVLWTKPER